MCLFALLAAVSVLVIVLVVVLVLAVILIVLVLVVVLVLILILLIHNKVLSFFVLRQGRETILPRNSGFILVLENQTDQKPAKNSGSHTAGCGFQSSGEDSKKPLLRHGFFNAFCKNVTESGQGHGSACPGKFHQGFVNTNSA